MPFPLFQRGTFCHHIKAKGSKRHVGFPSFSEVAVGLSCLLFCTHCRLSAPLQSISHFRTGLQQNREPLLSSRQQLYSVSCCLATPVSSSVGGRGLRSGLTRTVVASLPQPSQWASMTSAGSGKEGQQDTRMVALWCGWHHVSLALSLFLSHHSARDKRMWQNKRVWVKGICQSCCWLALSAGMKLRSNFIDH